MASGHDKRAVAAMPARAWMAAGALLAALALAVGSTGGDGQAGTRGEASAARKCPKSNSNADRVADRVLKRSKLAVTPSGPNRDKPKAKPERHRRFRSNRRLKPPAVTVTKRSSRTRSGYVFITPKRGRGQAGPMIVDDRGRVVWFRRVKSDRSAYDLRVQRYRGKPVLTWWEGETSRGRGAGVGYVMDSHYCVLKAVRMRGSGIYADLHEFLLTDRGTAWMAAYRDLTRDLRPVGGKPNDMVTEAVVQEVDVRTGKVLFEWHSLDDVPVTETTKKYDPEDKRPFDYFHINSIDETGDGDIIVSARRTDAVYRIDRRGRSGKVRWTLGGTKSDFPLSREDKFFLQHDARMEPGNRIRIFDNRDADRGHKRSRVVTFQLDEKAMSARRVEEVDHPDKILNSTQGNAQRLPGGGLFVGWGSKGVVSEFDSRGRLLFNATVPGAYDTYRGYRFEWRGDPYGRPRVDARRGAKRTTVRASWNGATEVARWRLLEGRSRKSVKRTRRAVRRRSFETSMTTSRSARYVAVEALDAAGKVLGRSFNTLVRR